MHIFCNLNEFEALTGMKSFMCRNMQEFKSLKVIDHSNWGYSFCDTGRTISGWSKTVDMTLWWHNKSAKSQHYSAPSGMIQI